MKRQENTKVRVKNFDWYKKNKDAYGNVLCGELYFTASMSCFCDKILTIRKINEDEKHYMTNDNNFLWTDEMFEDAPLFNDDGIANEINIPEGYLCYDDNGNVIKTNKITFKKVTPKYPKTYDECLEILGYSLFDVDGKMKGLPNKYASAERLVRIMICYDAFMKVYGGWKPDWNDDTTIKYVINCERGNITFNEATCVSSILAFPTKELRQKFYDYFYPMISECKNLL